VVTSGPYRYVRHPMYASTLLFFPGSALLLGSWGGLLFCAVLLGLLVWRTTLEDRMLKRTARIRRVRPQREVPAHPPVW
jgi:protein-S-isoprenylcysteine O-methyltransferase Ste14